jgi:hypothetical protein
MPGYPSPGGPDDGWSAEYEAGRQDGLAGRDADARKRVNGLYPIDYTTGYEAGVAEAEGKTE